MNSLFYAKSVVVIGVSGSRDNIAKNIVANMVNFGYRGEIYAVGPRGGEIHGCPIYRSVMELPGKPDLAVILTPARFVPDLLAQCGEKGVGWAVIETAGFREFGAEGEVLEKEILTTSKRYGIRFVGPNCIGAINTANGLYTPFGALPYPYRKGSVAVLTQSGGIVLSLAYRLCAAGMGISKLASIGNKLDLDEVDYLDYLMDDSDTAVIYFHLEDFKRGRSFVDLARRCSKPIILHKSNTSSLSRTIAQSHTAALAADDGVVDAVCKESGIVRARSVFEAVVAAKGLCLPVLKGNNLTVISRSGGHAVIAADACARHGFHLPPLGQEVLAEVQRHSRAGVIRIGNPVDLGDIYNLHSYLSIVETALRQDDIHGVVFIQVSQMQAEWEATRWLAERIPALCRRYAKPVAMVIEVPLEGRAFLEKNLDFPFFLEPTEAVEALAVQYHRSKPDGAGPIRLEHREVTIPLQDIEEWVNGIAKQKRQPLLHEALDLLDRIGIPTVSWRMTGSYDEALEAAGNLEFPVALKAVSPSLLHKSEKGGVALNIRDTQSLQGEWQRLQKVSEDVSGILVQKMTTASRELIIGGKRDPSFGPIVLAGFGGIMVEVMKDVRMRLAPINVNTAMQMLGELSGGRLLDRFRGMQKADTETAARIVATASLLMHHFPQISELDLNPVNLNDNGRGAVALDARLLLSMD